MKNTKIITGAVLILTILLVIPSITAIEPNQVQEGYKPALRQKIISSNNPVDNTVSIDSNIHLTRTTLPILQRAVGLVDNPTVKKIIQDIIITLSKKNVVTSTDIQNILDTLEISGVGIHTGPLISSGHGVAFSFPGLLFEGTLTSNYIGLAIIGFWETASGTTRAGFFQHQYSGNYNGYFIGFIGWIHVFMWEKGVDYNIIGLSGLIIIVP